MDSQPQKSPGSEEGIIKNWIIVGMNLISNHIETNRDSFLHLLPTVSVQYWKIYLDRQLSEDYCRRTSMKSCMCDTHGFTIWAHLLIWKKCSTTLWKYFFFYFASLLWWPIDLLKWFPETSGAKRYCTELSQGDRIKAEISELTFHSVRCEIKSAFPLTKYQFSPEKSHCNDESQ